MSATLAENTSMPDDLKELLTRLRGDRALLVAGEEATRQAAVLPILARLGWDRDNIREVVPEYAVGNGRVDYCLKASGRDVFVEVKRTSEELDRHQEQLLDYAFRQGVEIAALTNGLLWWLYLPLFRGSWEQRKFIAIDIQAQDIPTVAKNLSLFLGRDAIADGSAIKNADAIHKSREKDRLIREATPKAWAELCREPDETLVELLADKVESLCGHRPDDEGVAQFLASALFTPHSADGPSEPSGPPMPMTRAGRSVTLSDSWTFSAPAAFVFQGDRHGVATFKDVLVSLCGLLHGAQGQSFEQVLSLRGRKRAYFSRAPNEMLEPREIPGSGIYAETNLSANTIRDRCRDLLNLFGYSADDLQVELR